MRTISAAMCVTLAIAGGCRKDAPADGDNARDHFRRLMNVGRAYYENVSAKEAVAAFTQAVAIFPAEPVARMNLARSYRLAGSHDLVLAEVSQVLKLRPDSVAAHYYAGLSHLRLANTHAAIASLDRGVQLDPDTPAVRFQLAVALQQDGQLDRAIDELKGVIQRDETHWSAHFRLATLSRRVGDLDTARKHMEIFAALAKSLSAEQRKPEILERCQYTKVEVAIEVHQPPDESITVRFTQTPSPLQTPARGRAPLALFDADADGDQDLLFCDSSGAVRIAMKHGRTFIVLDHSLAELGSGAKVHARVADFDNDGRLDTLLFSIDRIQLLHNTEPGGLQIATTTLAQGGLRDAVWVDYDHDGDVDLASISKAGQLALWRNNGDGSFADISHELPAFDHQADAIRLFAVDIEGDDAVDLLVSFADGPARWLKNLGLGKFVWGGQVPHGDGLAITADVNNDLQPDLLAVGKTNVVIARSIGGDQTFSHSCNRVSDVHLIDYDNDGWLDVLLQCDPSNSQTGGTLRLFRNRGDTGWVDVTDRCGLSHVVALGDWSLLIGDVDGDGDSDLLVHGSEGIAFIDNVGGSANHQLQVNLVGTRSNRAGIGAIVEVHAGAFRLSRLATGSYLEIGIGNRTVLDSVRSVWTNGIVQHAVDVNVNESLTIKEPHVAAGSCPYLYAWDGTSYRFVTDILGASPLGLSLRRGVMIQADTDEYVFIGSADQFPPRKGRYSIMITDELREMIYLDHVHLVAADHPAETEVHVTDKLMPPPFPPSKLKLLHAAVEVISARDNHGNDWTGVLRYIDGERTQPPLLRPGQLRGLAEPHWLELDFGDFTRMKAPTLVMTGWIMWGDAGVNVGVGQRNDLPNPWPTLQAYADNQWHDLDVVVGAPAGKPKTILVDLTGALPDRSKRLRLKTSFEIYWDRIALLDAVDQPQWRVTRLDPTRAELRWRGFPRQLRQSPRDPIVPDVTRIESTPPWKRSPRGHATRYGDVRELVNKVDDELVILSGGDALMLEFDSELPPLSEGWVRDFFLYSDGWDKDSDYNVRAADTVEPLPYHGMNDQLYGVEIRESGNDAWTKRYNTRPVGR